jgi:hypothetical protein
MDEDMTHALAALLRLEDALARIEALLERIALGLGVNPHE